MQQQQMPPAFIRIAISHRRAHTWLYAHTHTRTHIYVCAGVKRHTHIPRRAMTMIMPTASAASSFVTEICFSWQFPWLQASVSSVNADVFEYEPSVSWVALALFVCAAAHKTGASLSAIASSM